MWDPPSLKLRRDGPPSLNLRRDSPPPLSYGATGWRFGLCRALCRRRIRPNTGASTKLSGRTAVRDASKIPWNQPLLKLLLRSRERGLPLHPAHKETVMQGLVLLRVFWNKGTAYGWQGLRR